MALLKGFPKDNVLRIHGYAIPDWLERIEPESQRKKIQEELKQENQYEDWVVRWTEE